MLERLSVLVLAVLLLASMPRAALAERAPGNPAESPARFVEVKLFFPRGAVFVGALTKPKGSYMTALGRATFRSLIASRTSFFDALEKRARAMR